MKQPMRLKQLGLLWRFGLTCLLLVLSGGLIASAVHLVWHYENRDERPGLTVDDIKAQYAGLNAPAPMLVSLNQGHPETLKPADREALVKWLKTDKVAEMYDSLDLGTASPSEIIAASCLQCHSRKATGADAKARALVLDYYDDVKKVAFGRTINPTPNKIKVISTHTHAPAMAGISFTLAILLAFTRWPRFLAGFLLSVAGLGLAVDIACWWLAPYNPNLAYAIVGGGIAYNAATGLQILLTFADLWLPGGRQPTDWV